jgi:hypothetical protein
MAEKNEFAFLETLSAEDTELPSVNRSGGGGRSRAVQDNPFVPWLSESHQTGKGKSVTVPANQAVRTEYLIRQAAEDLGIGVRVVRLVDGSQVDKAAIKELHPNKKVKVMFQGQKKRAYSPRKRKNADTGAEMVISE